MIKQSLLILITTLVMCACVSKPKTKQSALDTSAAKLSIKTTASISPKKEEPFTAEILDSKGAVAIEVIPQYATILSNTKGELNLLLKLDGKEVATIKRHPLDLGIVIDRSGSMSGNKIAAVKTAALELLNRLTKDDVVTLISYSDDVQVHAVKQPLDEQGTHILRNEILRIFSGGGTALGPATIESQKRIGQTAGDKTTLSHILLLSDGLANIGLSDPAIIGHVCAEGFAREVSFSTLGVGLDYNEDLMTHLADEGGGQYHFIKEEKMIASVLEDEFKGLNATVAREIIVEITPATGTQIKNVYGYPSSTVNGKTLIKVGSLRSGQNRDIMISLKIDPTTQPQLDIGNIKLTFKDLLYNGSLESISMAPFIHTTEDKMAMTTSENAEVTVRLAEVKSSDELKLAANAVQMGDYVQAEQVLTNSISYLETQQKRTPDAKIDTQLTELKNAKADLEKAKTSNQEKQFFVKKRKSAAYKKNKSTKNRTSTFDKLKKKKAGKKKANRK